MSKPVSIKPRLISFTWNFLNVQSIKFSLINVFFACSREVFTTDKGSRPNVKKVLIVITDGETFDSNVFPLAIREANKKNIVRFAIGVSFIF